MHDSSNLVAVSKTWDMKKLLSVIYGKECSSFTRIAIYCANVNRIPKIGKAVIADQVR